MKILKKKVRPIKALTISLGVVVGIEFVAATVLFMRSCKKRQQVSLLKEEFNKILSSNEVITKDLVKNYANKPEIDEIFLPSNVKEVKEDAFNGFKHVKFLKITKSTGLIGKNAFKNMDSLQEIQIPNKSHIIGTNDLPNKIKIKYGDEKYTKEQWTEKWNKEDLKFDDSIISLSYNAFNGMSNIKKIDTNKVEYISSNVFSNKNLKEITLNNSIKRIIKDEIFSNDLTLNKLLIGQALHNKELNNELKKIKEINNVKILEGTNKIPDNAFKDVKIKSIDLALTVKEIGKNAFANSKINEVDLKNTETILEDAFNSSNIKKVSFNSNLKTIKSRAFANCTFDNIDLFEKIDQIDDDVFLGSSILGNLKIGKLLEVTNINNVLSKFSLIKNITVKGTIKNIPSMSLANIDINKLILEEGIEEISAKAFDKAKIKYLKFADSITKIYKATNVAEDDNGTFSNVGKIDTLQIGKALKNCSDLEELFYFGPSKSFGRFNTLKLNSSIGELNEDIWNPSIKSKNLHFSNIELDSKFTTLGDKTFKNVQFENINLENITDLGRENFSSCSHINELTFSDKMTKISDGAFMNTTCFDEHSVINFKNVSEIGEKAFYNSSINNVDFTKITKIGKSAFENSKLANVVDLANVEEIEESAFKNCNFITKIDNGNIKSIGKEAFYKCSKLEKINLSNTNLNEISDYAFYECKLLSEINLENIKTIGYSAFFGCSSLTNINLKNALNIKNHAFESNTNLTSIGDFENEVKLGDFAFANNVKLQNAKLENITELGKSTFENCKELQIADKFNDQITNIPESCFNNCEKIEELDFNNVETIQKNAFKNAKKMKINNSKKLRVIGESSLLNVGKNNPTMETIDTDSLEEIENNGCEGLNVNKINLKSLQKIGDEAFKESSIKEIIDFEKSNIRKLTKKLFYKCNKLGDIDLSKIEEIDEFTFYGCNHLVELNLSSLKNLKYKSFLNASSLKKIDLSSLEQDEILDETFGRCSNLEEVKLSSNVKTIGNNAFLSCSKLTKINLENVERIRTRGFYKCSSLKKINLSALKDIGIEAFADNTNLDEVILGNNVKNVLKSAFENTSSLKEINLNKIEIIQENAFKNSGLEKIDVKNVHRIGKSAFENVKFKELDLLEFKHGTNIHQFAFKNVEFKLNAKIDFKGSASLIGDEAFYGIKNVDQILNGHNVKRVGNKAFAKSSLCGKGLTKENTFPNAEFFGENVFQE